LSSLLGVEGISKRFGSNDVLQDARFSVLSGEVLGLIGPNGAGKTTLFECIAGLMRADRGDVLFRDRPLPARRRKEALFYLPDAIRLT
jgi:ABC-2 type transport system ATP-binding protein